MVSEEGDDCLILIVLVPRLVASSSIVCCLPL
jgi:hypothetical protein